MEAARTGGTGSASRDLKKHLKATPLVSIKRAVDEDAEMCT